MTRLVGRVSPVAARVVSTVARGTHRSGPERTHAQCAGVDHDVTRRTVMAAVRDLDGPTVRDALLQSLLTCGVDDTVTEVRHARAARGG